MTPFSKKRKLIETQSKHKVNRTCNTITFVSALVRRESIPRADTTHLTYNNNVPNIC